MDKYLLLITLALACTFVTSKSYLEVSPNVFAANNTKSGYGYAALDSPELDTFNQRALDQHNHYRAIHQVKPLKHNEDLRVMAQKMAEKMSILGQLDTSLITQTSYKSSIVGGNMAHNWPIVFTGEVLTDLWYKNADKYKFDTPFERQDLLTIGSFTQVVWKSTEEVAFGAATLHGKWYYVALYYPSGNVHGEGLANVFPPEKSALLEDTTTATTTTTATLTTTEPRSDTTAKPRWDTTAEPTTTGHIDENLSLIELGAFSQQALDQHNYYRSIHQVKPLELNEDLRIMAQKMAEKIAKINQLDTSLIGDSEYKSSNVGGNMAMNLQTILTGESLSDSWYKNAGLYNYQQQFSYQDLLTIGSFTQMVWNSTEEVAFGVAKCNGSWFYVALYYPAGNIIGQGLFNVFPPKNPTPTTETIETTTVELQTETTTRATNTNILDIVRIDYKPKFNNELLGAHNVLRETSHKVGPLKLSLQLVQLAQNLTDRLALAGKLDDTLITDLHYKNDFVGVNMASSDKFIDVDVIYSLWYQKGSGYNYTIDSSEQDAGSFTQMVWKATTLMGAGFSEDPRTGKFYYAAVYYPAGNFKGQSLDNVFEDKMSN